MSSDFDILLKNYDAGIRELTSESRALITKLVPGAEEKVYFGWRVIRYSLDGTMKGQFIAIGPLKKHVNLYFMRGTALDDPNGLLEGTGKNMRHVKITSSRTLKSAALKKLIKTAVELQQARMQS